MELDININNLFGDEITKLDKRVIPFRKNADGFNYQELRQQLFTVIDKIGHASSKAQGLYGPITLARKLELSDHHLYVMKDREANNGQGGLVGILKVGHKRLFVYNNLNNVNEMEPLCVLDFYVHESRQRMGCGKQLFDHMLISENVKAQHLAIDRPSYKFSQFLLKHYNLKSVIPQVNNFVVFDGFFSNRTDASNRHHSGLGRPPFYPLSRDTSDNLNLRRTNLIRNLGLPPVPQDRYGRNLVNSRPNSGKASRLTRTSEETDSLRQLNMSVRPYSHPRRSDTIQDIADSKNLSLHLTQDGFAHTGADENRYSRHSRAGTPTKGQSSGRNSFNESGGVKIGDENNKVDNHRERNSPLLLQREGPQQNYKENLNLHSEYQDRGGHLRVNSGCALMATNSTATNSQFRAQSIPNLPGTESHLVKPWRLPQVKDKTWTVFNDQNGYQNIAARNYSHTRLW